MPPSDAEFQAIAVYVVIALPLLFVGDQDTTTEVVPGAAVMPATALGRPYGISLIAFDSELEPTAVIALIFTEYDVPLVRPLSKSGDAVRPALTQSPPFNEYS
jgi:hypothetical protein